MRKLSMMCGLAVILTLVSVPAFALEFKFDFHGGDTGLSQGDFEDPQEVTLFQSETVMVDIWLTGWDAGARGNIAAVDYYFPYSPSITVNSMVCNNLKSSVPPGVWDDSYQVSNTNEYACGVVEYGLAVPGPDVLLHTAELHCNAVGDDPIKATLSPDGIVLNVDGDEFTDVSDADGILHQEEPQEPQCECEIAPSGVELSNGESQTFTASQKNPVDCDNPPNFAWSTDCAAGSLAADCYGNTTCDFTAADSIPAEETCSVTVVDLANTGDPGVNVTCSQTLVLKPPLECTVFLKVEETAAQPGDLNVQVPVSMKNPVDKVLAIETVLLDQDNSLTCTGCTRDPDRAPDFQCFASEQGDGSCKIIMATFKEDALIAEAGDYEPIFNVDYLFSQCEDQIGCIGVDIVKEATIIVDDSEIPLPPPCVEAGQICFVSCGDVYPSGGTSCGDGAVNIFDILEEIDFALGITAPTIYQAPRANVPTGLPTNCEDPDVLGRIDILDILVIIDKALGKPNCCDYYYFGEI